MERTCGGEGELGCYGTGGSTRDVDAAKYLVALSVRRFGFNGLRLQHTVE